MFDGIFGFKFPWTRRRARRAADQRAIDSMRVTDALMQQARDAERRERERLAAARRARVLQQQAQVAWDAQRDAVREMQQMRHPTAAVPRSQSGLSPRNDDVTAPAWQNHGNDDGNRIAVASAPIGRGGSFDGGSCDACANDCSSSSSDSGSSDGGCGGGGD